MNSKVALLPLLFFYACSQKESSKILDLKRFSIRVPSTWSYAKLQGIDSYVGAIVTADGDSLVFDYGWYSNSLDEELPYKIENGNVYLKNPKSTYDSVIFDFYGQADTVDVRRFHKNIASIVSIDGRSAKLVQPRKIGNGMTGMFIDSVWVEVSGVDRLEIHGTNLKPHNNEAALQAFKTIRFVRHH